MWFFSKGEGLQAAPLTAAGLLALSRNRRQPELHSARAWLCRHRTPATLSSSIKINATRPRGATAKPNQMPLRARTKGTSSGAMQRRWQGAERCGAEGMVLRSASLPVGWFQHPSHNLPVYRQVPAQHPAPQRGCSKSRHRHFQAGFRQRWSQAVLTAGTFPWEDSTHLHILVQRLRG